MSTLTQEIVEICDSLPEEKVAAVAKFARALREGAEAPGDAAWERIVSETSPRPMFEEFMQRAFADGEDEPLDDKMFLEGFAVQAASPCAAGPRLSQSETPAPALFSPKEPLI